MSSIADSPLSSHISLLVAALDLKLVQLVRGAIRTADLSSGKGAPASGLGPAPNPDIGLRRHLEPEPVIEPRRHIHPTDYYEPRQVIHPKPCVAPCPCPPAPLCPPEPDYYPPIPIAPVATYATSSPIQPPWKILPWQNPPAARPIVKIVIKRTDIVHKGSLIDCFL